MGIWHATCKECGFRVSDAVRRRAAAVYRQHIKQMDGGSSLAEALVIDLTPQLEMAKRPPPLSLR